MSNEKTNEALKKLDIQDGDAVVIIIQRKDTEEMLHARFNVDNVYAAGMVEVFKARMLRKIEAE